MGKKDAKIPNEQTFQNWTNTKLGTGGGGEIKWKEKSEKFLPFMQNSAKFKIRLLFISSGIAE